MDDSSDEPQPGGPDLDDLEDRVSALESDWLRDRLSADYQIRQEALSKAVELAELGTPAETVLSVARQYEAYLLGTLAESATS